MEIRVYNPMLYRQGVIENHTALLWGRKYYDPGNFELHAPITTENLQLLVKENIIAKADSKEAGVIEDIVTNENDNVNEIVVTGRFLSSYLDRRVIKNTINFSGNVEVAMRQLVTSVVPIPLLELGALQEFTETVAFQVTMKNLQSFLTKLAKCSSLGYRLRPDFKNKKLIFEVYKGLDHTSSQIINSRVIFSESYENLNNATYSFNNQLYKNHAIVGGEGEGSTRKYVYVSNGASEGLELRELFVDAKDISSDGLTTAEYEALLIQRGNETLTERSIKESLECETEANVNFTYRTDYDLGDIVTAEKRKWGIKIDQRLTEVQEIYQDGGLVISPTFGEPLPETVNFNEE